MFLQNARGGALFFKDESFLALAHIFRREAKTA